MARYHPADHTLFLLMSKLLVLLFISVYVKIATEDNLWPACANSVLKNLTIIRNEERLTFVYANLVSNHFIHFSYSNSLS